MAVVIRFLVLVAFAFWQGGFAFYTAVVVPIGTGVLGSPSAQGMITRHVAYWINVSGAAALVLMMWESLTVLHLRSWRVAIVTLAVAMLALQFLLLRHLDSMIDPDGGIVHERATFQMWHRVYLWLSTTQWAGAVAWLALTMMAWRRNER